MPTTWLENEDTKNGRDAKQILEHLQRTGVLARAEEMMAQDLADIDAGKILDDTISAAEFRQMLENAKR